MQFPDNRYAHEDDDEVRSQVCRCEYGEHVESIGTLREKCVDGRPVQLPICATLENSGKEE